MDFIPTTNAQFVSFLLALSAAVTASPTSYGLTPADATALAAATADVDGAYATINDPSTRTAVTIEDFNTKRQAATVLARSANNTAQAFGSSSVDLVAAGLPVREGTRTSQGAVTDSIDLGLVSAVPEILTLTARDSANPTSGAKPAGTGAIELAVAIGEVAATDPAQANDRRIYTKSGIQYRTDTNQRGKVATIFARYESAGSIDGQKVYGPYSMPLTLRLP